MPDKPQDKPGAPKAHDEAVSQSQANENPRQAGALPVDAQRVPGSRPPEEPGRAFNDPQPPRANENPQQKQARREEQAKEQREQAREQAKLKQVAFAEAVDAICAAVQKLTNAGVPPAGASEMAQKLYLATCCKED